MNEDISQLAENKLVLLHILHKINIPLSNNQITQIVLENSLVNYFLLQQYISELLNSGFIEQIFKNDKKLITITDKGIKVLTLFSSRIPQNIAFKIDSYINEKKENLKKEISLHADYTIENTNVFIVNLKASENDTILIDIKVNVPTKKHAIDLCSSWKSNSSKIYNDIMNLLISNI